MLAPFWRRAAGAFSILALVFAVAVFGQGGAGLVGRVLDAAGAAVPNAEVRLISGATLVATTRSDADGRFEFRNIQPGLYDIEVVAPAGSARAVGVPARSGAAATVTITVTAPTPPPPPPPPPPFIGKSTRADASHANVTVFFATDRERASIDPLAYSSNRSNGTLRLGQVDVHVPRLHELGRVERPTWYEFWNENDDKYFVITRAVEQNSGDFYAGLKSAVGKSSGKQALIFIHGFNVTFEAAAMRTAQISYDLDFDGAPILYSWPSEGRLLRYPTDLNNNEWTVPHLKDFLKDVSEKSGASTIHIVAHSMGNRALMNALQALAASEPPTARPRFNQVAFTAPDIDADVFRQISGSLRRLIAHGTLYASSRDKALEASKTYNKYQRAGDTLPSVVVVQGIDTIDVSAVDSEFVGHFYYGSNRSVLSDLFYVLQGLAPDKRATLRRAQSTAGTYWAFKP